MFNVSMNNLFYFTFIIMGLNLINDVIELTMIWVCLFWLAGALLNHKNKKGTGFIVR